MTRVLITYPGLIPSTLLCGHLQLDFLAKRGDIAFRSISRDALTSEDCGWPDVVFLVRSDSEIDVARTRAWKCANKKIVYVLDDDLLNIPSEVGSHTHYQQVLVRKSIYTLIELCDVFLSPSEHLQKKYGCGKAFSIEEPSPYHAKKVQKSGGVVRIGFAGSLDRASDIDCMLASVLEDLLDRYGAKICVEFFGAQPQIAYSRNLNCIPYCDNYEEYQKTMMSLDWDIGLAPMPETPFHRCKHYNKFIEYAGCGIAGIYSDTLPYTHIVRHEQNGLLCANSHQEWMCTISRLIEDVALRAQISKCAQQQAQEAFSIEKTALDLKANLADILHSKSNNYQPIKVSIWLKIKSFLRRIWFFLCLYRMKSPIIAVKKMQQRWARQKVSY